MRDKTKKKKASFWTTVKKNRTLLLMVLPGFVWFIFFFYIPVFANVVAFKDFHYSAGGFLESLNNSPWVGLDNFKFLFSSKDAWLITKNTLAYNLVFLAFNVFFAIAFAIVMSELRNKRGVKIYHTMSLLPYFLSWVVIEYFVYAFLNPDRGMINNTIVASGGQPIMWYSNPTWWPLILLIMNVWKGLGYNSIIYYASVVGISDDYYEAAMVDGANKWQQIKNITIPQLLPMMSILLILNIGSIFRSDFGLFFQIPKNSGALYEVTSVLDTYVYNGLTATGDIGMASAASLYQSIVGTCILLISNAIVRKWDPESALF
ncbi:ABC transporter permease [Streptococcus parauberis]|uniref:Putative multiple-sugar transport system permease YteP n=1 Tax=Streptococcus parauberis TaxID=1348 RepID=A0A0E2UCW2_9STRE|nr:sugar ABC transporter permease [Streptococcus parauberis]AEF25658.1 binding-protein-dependent transport system membrane protein [Streptococcus parauberis KCTC 11537]PCH12820.1 putative multiple-sugar transport system permease YteP [Streptococcus parauberis]UWM90125.1 sugar ABC transporter permease [Streptococcus parauberis]GAJ61978.1 binding-protein-dependent transport system membrane protein [Streptococcus parauberis]